MAKEVKIIIDVDTKSANKDLEQTEEQIDSLGFAANKASEDVKEVGESAKEAGDDAKKSSKGFSVLGTAMKITGIGGLVGAFTSFGDVLMKNQRFADIFNIALTMAEMVMSDLFNKVIDVVMSFSDFGKKLKNLTSHDMKEFSEKLLTQLLLPLTMMRDIIHDIGSAMNLVFKGDFEGAGKAASKTMNDLAQDIIDLTEDFTDAQEETEKYFKSIMKDSMAINESRKRLVMLVGEINMQKAAIQGVINEQTRLRDSEHLTFEQRQEFAMRLLDQQILMLEQEKKMAEAVKKNAEEELRIYPDNIQAIQKLENAKAALMVLEEQETQLILQQTQAYHDLGVQRIGSIKELQSLNKLGREREELELNEHYKTLLEQARKAGEGEAEVLEFYERKKEEIRVKYRDMNLQATSRLFGALAGTAEKGSKNWKMMAKAQALVNMYLGITSALKDPEMPWFARIANAAAVAIAGRNNIKSISATKMSGDEGEGEEGDVPSPTGVGGIFSGNAGSMIPNQLTEEVVDTSQQPVQAYVVETDISNSQALQEELDLQTTL
jgi:hypothetical protein